MHSFFRDHVLFLHKTFDTWVAWKSQNLEIYLECIDDMKEKERLASVDDGQDAIRLFFLHQINVDLMKTYY